MMRKGYHVDKDFYQGFEDQIIGEHGDAADNINNLIAERTQKIHQDFNNNTAQALH